MISYCRDPDLDYELGSTKNIPLQRHLWALHAWLVGTIPFQYPFSLGSIWSNFWNHLVENLLFVRFKDWTFISVQYRALVFLYLIIRFFGYNPDAVYSIKQITLLLRTLQEVACFLVTLLYWLFFSEWKCFSID